MKEEEKELKKLKKKSEKKKKELHKVRNKIMKLEDKLNKRNVHGRRRRRGRSSLDVDTDDMVLVEEVSDGNTFVVDLSLMEDDQFVHIDRLPSDFDRYPGSRKPSLVNSKTDEDGALKFLDTELEPVSEHRHDGLIHRTWKLTGDELLAFRMLREDRELGRVYVEEGWEGIKEKLEELKNQEKQAIPGSIDSKKRRRIFDRSDPLRERIFKYAVENDLTPREAVVGLKLEDQAFAKGYEEAKQRLRNKIEDLERAFFPLISINHGGSKTC